MVALIVVAVALDPAGGTGDRRRVVRRRARVLARRRRLPDAAARRVRLRPRRVPRRARLLRRRVLDRSARGDRDGDRVGGRRACGRTDRAYGVLRALGERAGPAAAGRDLHGGDRGDGRVRDRVGQRRRRQPARCSSRGSDSLIAWDRFVRPVAGAGVTIMVTYHVGQILLVLSLLV